MVVSKRGSLCLSYISGTKIAAAREYTHLGSIVTEDEMRDKKLGKHGNSGRCLLESYKRRGNLSRNKGKVQENLFI